MARISSSMYFNPYTDPERIADLQDEPYKLTTISKDLREVHAISGDFLVQEGQVTFLITDRKGDMRMLDFDPAGEAFSPLGP